MCRKAAEGLSGGIQSDCEHCGIISVFCIKKTACRLSFSLSKKYYFNFYASCGSTHKIEFAKQIHKKSGRVPDFLYKGRKNVPVGRGFSSVFARKRGFEREAARKTIVFRQPQRQPIGCLLLFVYGKCSYVHSPFSIQNLPLLPCPDLLVWLMLPENPAPP